MASVREIRGIEKTKGQNDTARLNFIIGGATDFADAELSLAGALSATFSGLVLRDYGVREQGGGTYLGHAVYTKAGKLNPTLTTSDPEQWEFVTEGGSQRITQSISTVQAYSTEFSFAPGFSPFGGAIGVGQDGNIDGIEVDVAGARIRARRVITAAQATSAYVNLLMRMRGGVNNAAWRGLAAGEVKFRVGSTQTRANGDVELIREWDVSPNQTGISIGGMTGIDKDGWDALWVRYEDVEDATRKIIARVPKFAIVERVYPRIDFAVLEPPP